jgi:hypothetical protein
MRPPRKTCNRRDFRSAAQKKSGLPHGSPEDQAYLRVPSIPSVAWQPYPSPLGRLRAHSFASPPHDGFAFLEDDREVVCSSIRRRGCSPSHRYSRTRLPVLQIANLPFLAWFEHCVPHRRFTRHATPRESQSALRQIHISLHSLRASTVSSRSSLFSNRTPCTNHLIFVNRAMNLVAVSRNSNNGRDKGLQTPRFRFRG